ncbi:MAG: hypothetical protein ABIA93_01775 [Candidatus Woesearchaeota archaeon]
MQSLNTRGNDFGRLIFYVTILGVIALSLSFLLNEGASERAGRAFVPGINTDESDFLGFGACNPPNSGNWIISSPAMCKDITITMNGNVSVTSSLELINVTLIFNSTSPEGYVLEAKPNSILRIFYSSIKSNSEDNHFSIFVRENVYFSMVGTSVTGAGSKDPELLAHETPETNNAKYREYGRYFGCKVNISGTCHCGPTME